MPSETLVEALEAANVSANGGWLIAPKDCAALLPILARFASPEAKREVLAALLADLMDANEDHVNRWYQDGYVKVSGERGDNGGRGGWGAVWVRSTALLKLLTPTNSTRTETRTTKIVRKVDKMGLPVAFWLDSLGDVCVWVDGNRITPEIAATHGMGRLVGEGYAADNDFDLAALRDELTEEGKDGE